MDEGNRFYKDKALSESLKKAFKWYKDVEQEDSPDSNNWIVCLLSNGKYSLMDDEIESLKKEAVEHNVSISIMNLSDETLEGRQ